MAGAAEVIGRVVGAVREFFAAPVSGASAALFRVAFGLVVLVNGYGLLLNTERYFSDSGALPWDLAPAAKSWGAFALAPHDIGHAYHVLLAYVILAGMLTIGAAARPACAGLWYLHLSIYYRNNLITSAADSLLGMMLFIAIFLPLSRRWSVDAWVVGRLGARWPGVLGWWERRGPTIWSARLMQAQIALLYGITVSHKLEQEVWLDGDALRGFLAMPSYATWPAWHEPWPFMKLLTWGTVVFEVCFPVLVWVRPCRRWVLAAGVAFHLGIDTLMQIPMFSWLMISAYIMFLPDEEVERAVASVRKVVADRAAGPS